VGYNVAPKVSVPSYQISGSKLPSFYRGWSRSGSTALARPSSVEYMSWNDLIYDYELPNNVAPLVTRISYEYSDPRQMGGYDPWDPISNAFGVSLSTATVEGVWDDDGIPNNTVPVAPQVTFEWSDPRQPGGYDPWDPIGNAFGVK
jgi:hypothetical protein